MKTVLGYVATKDREQAVTLGRMLVEKRLVACANILPAMESIYHWDGKTQHSQEALLILKTTAKLQEKVTALVKALHSYDTPGLVFLPIEGGFEGYLKWVTESVG